MDPLVVGVKLLAPPRSLQGESGIDSKDNTVVNLVPGLVLSQVEHDLLSKGLTFVPSFETHKRNSKKILSQELDNYHRKLKLAFYFKNVKSAPPPPFVGPSAWEPPVWSLPLDLRDLIKKDRDDLNKMFRKNFEIPNLTEGEIKTLGKLSNNPNIVIKKADKGSAVVLMSRADYIQEAERQLSDGRYYRELPEPIFLKTRPVVYRVVNNLLRSGHISRRQAQFLRGDPSPRLRRFYTLPKIHKDQRSWTVPFKIPPGRPIVSDCNSETCASAHFVEHYLNPLSVRHPSYVKDTGHFVQIIRNLSVPSHALLFTIDVDSLYTNIDTHSGLQAVRDMFRRYPDQGRPESAILTLLHINLIKNDFVFNDRFYLQVKGTAMGKKFAPSYANIFMARWEEKVLATCSKLPLVYLRYLDDIFGVWTHTESEFNCFFRTLDSFDPSIRLKSTTSFASVDFLDTTVFKGAGFVEKGVLDVKVFFKETNTHALLHKTSFHPRHTFKGLVTSQVLRYRRISTWESDFNVSVRTLFKVLRRRGYSRSFLRRCYREGLQKYSLEVNRSAEARPDTHTNTHIIPLISTFNTLTSTLQGQYRKNFLGLIKDDWFKLNYRVVSAYSRNKNLSNYLIRAKLPSLD